MHARLGVHAPERESARAVRPTRSASDRDHGDRSDGEAGPPCGFDPHDRVDPRRRRRVDHDARLEWCLIAQPAIRLSVRIDAARHDALHGCGAHCHGGLECQGGRSQSARSSPLCCPSPSPLSRSRGRSFVLRRPRGVRGGRLRRLREQARIRGRASLGAPRAAGRPRRRPMSPDLVGRGDNHRDPCRLTSRCVSPCLATRVAEAKGRYRLAPVAVLLGGGTECQYVAAWLRLWRPTRAALPDPRQPQRTHPRH